jgi:hypothetical protein
MAFLLLFFFFFFFFLFLFLFLFFLRCLHLHTLRIYLPRALSATRKSTGIRTY